MTWIILINLILLQSDTEGSALKQYLISLFLDHIFIFLILSFQSDKQNKYPWNKYCYFS